MSNCVATGGWTEYCECAVDWFEDNVAFEDYVAAETRFLMGEASDNFVDWMAKAVSTCLQ